MTTIQRNVKRLLGCMLGKSRYMVLDIEMMETIRAVNSLELRFMVNT